MFTIFTLYGLFQSEGGYGRPHHHTDRSAWLLHSGWKHSQLFTVPPAAVSFTALLFCVLTGTGQLVALWQSGF